MTAATVTDLSSFREKREDEHFEIQSRALGFRSYADLEAAVVADEEAEIERLQAQCSHSNKHPASDMCMDCGKHFPQ